MTTDLSRVTARASLKARRAKPFFMQHPWVYTGAIARVDGAPAAGDLVDVVDHRERFVGRGFFDPDSQIAVRLVSWDADERVDAAWARRRLTDALALRRETLKLDAGTDAYRLVHAEGDRLPGLIVDHFAGHLVVTITDVGVARRRDWFIHALSELVAPASILEKEATVGEARRHVCEARGDVGREPTPERVQIHESGVAFEIDLCGGQKTGWFCDQRENRLAAARHAAGRSVLDVYSYAGAFGVVCAVKGDARQVTSVDTSVEACELAAANAALSQVEERITVMRADALKYLAYAAESEEAFDMVIVDPPKLASRRSHLANALGAYRRINRRALRVLAPGGILVSCSCSGVLAPDVFVRTINEAAHETRRELRLIEERSQAPDHPVNPACPQTQYLKCLIFSVV